MPTRPTRSVACQRCHGRRVKCSGGQPCTNCRRARVADCVYPKKDRLVKVSQQYIDELTAENERLQRLVAQPETHVEHGPEDVAQQDRENGDSSPQSPQLASAPWFVNVAVPHTPILLAEASDSAFATRFRQAMSSPEHGHLPRISFAADSLISALSESPCPWPNAPLARLLIKAALTCLGSWCHIVRRSVILEELDLSLEQTHSLGSLRRNKFWALFAIGKMYSTRASTASGTFPGLEYFAKATRVLTVMTERPTVEMVETWLLLSYYSLCLNRRHCAYSLAGSAVRTSIIMGLHLNVPETQLPNGDVREHRKRVWWTAYTLERMWSTKIGCPPAVDDADIEVELPSNMHANGDFADPAHSVAMIQLAKISGSIIHSIYSKRSQQTTLSRRVHDSLSALRQWRLDLPPELRLDPVAEDSRDQCAQSTYLLSNQLVIAATRPILLHVFRTRLRAKETATPATIPESARVLSNACIQCARYSCRILTNAWLRGTFMMFDYFYTQYLFAAATILAISSVLDDQDSRADGDAFDTAVQFLVQLKDIGNYPAAEFAQHAEAMRSLFACVETSTQHSQFHGPLSAAAEGDGVMERGTDPAVGIHGSTADAMQAGSLFPGLLSQQTLDLEFIDASLNADAAHGFYWPDLDWEPTS